MITLLSIWGWLLLGAAIGRIVFVRVLADQSRRGPVRVVDQWGHFLRERDGWSGAFVRAAWAGVACFIAWPIALPLALMVAQTGTEKLRARRERLAAEVARLEQEAQR